MLGLGHKEYGNYFQGTPSLQAVSRRLKFSIFPWGLFTVLIPVLAFGFSFILLSALKTNSVPNADIHATLAFLAIFGLGNGLLFTIATNSRQKGLLATTLAICSLFPSYYFDFSYYIYTGCIFELIVMGSAFPKYKTFKGILNAVITTVIGVYIAVVLTAIVFLTTGYFVTLIFESSWQNILLPVLVFSMAFGNYVLFWWWFRNGYAAVPLTKRPAKRTQQLNEINLDGGLYVNFF